AELSSFTVEMHIRDHKSGFKLAMAVHPEYDDKYWRYIEGLQVDGGKMIREDSTLWRIETISKEVVIKYRIKIPAQGYRGAWKPFLASNGAQVGDIHSFMYIVGETWSAAYVKLSIPQGWKIATALRPTGDPNVFFASSVDELMDSPILLGA